MSEAELQADVIALAKVLGWSVWHQHDSRRTEHGWPDLFCLHPHGRAIAIELKRERGRLTPAQVRTLALLTLADIPTYVFRPTDWLAGTIERALMEVVDDSPDG